MKIAVGLSGGVDSAVSAYLLKEQGHEVVGAIMRLWREGGCVPKPGKGNACYGPDEVHDVDDARRVCDHLGISLQVIDCADQYEHQVLRYFREEYASGRTPNPCIICNHAVKFGVLPELLAESGTAFDRFATGHYARLSREPGSGTARLLRAVDTAKDQTYFLYRLSEEQLGRAVFPLGGLTKQAVRGIAAQAGLPVHDKPESQDFYSGDYADLLDKEDCGGLMVDTVGSVIGRHEGIWHYTIGQRKGLGVAAGRPLYVIAIDAGKNRVVLGDREDLLAPGLIARNLVGFRTIMHGRGTVKIRSTGAEVPCSFSARDDRLAIEFDEPQLSVTPGQSAVVYAGEAVVGGGIIEAPMSRNPPDPALGSAE
jgi:tRNA-specific 2-thiouridylase